MSDEIAIDHPGQTAVTVPATNGPLTLREMSPDHWRTITEQAVTLEAAGKGTSILPKGITNRYQIAAIIAKGHELGLPPLYSLEQIALVNGKPVVQGQALLAIVQRAHGAGAVRLVESTAEKATFIFHRAGVPDMTLTWSLEDAKRAGLLSRDGPWKSYPRTMLRWRCIAEGARLHFADTIAGIYLPDEMGLPSSIDSSGNLVMVGEPEPEGERGAVGSASRSIREPTPNVSVSSYDGTGPVPDDWWDAQPAPGQLDPSPRVRVARALATMQGDRLKRAANWLREHYGTANVAQLTDGQLGEICQRWSSSAQGSVQQTQTEPNGQSAEHALDVDAVDVVELS